MEYRVISNFIGEAEFEIRVSVELSGHDKYELIPIGNSWSEEIVNKPVLTIIDDGNGVVIDHKIGKRVDYNEVANLFILLSFMNQHNVDKLITVDPSRIYSGRIEKVSSETILKM